MKVNVCCPMGGRITASFVRSLLKFNSWTASEDGRKFGSFRFFDWGGSDIYIVRNSCLRYPFKGNPDEHPVVTPWAGECDDYDRVLWIDSDTVFTVDEVKQLLSHDEDIVAGCVKVDFDNFALQVITHSPYGGTQFATIRDKANHPETGQIVDCFGLWVEENQQENGLCPVDMIGGAFMSVKKGVYEAMGYPWFRPYILNVDGVQIEQSEDIAWCCRAREMGFRLWADPKVRPGHDKGGIVLR